MNGMCNERLRKRRVVTIDSFEDVPENDEVSLKKAVAHQPVSVAIEADQKAFQVLIGCSLSIVRIAEHRTYFAFWKRGCNASGFSVVML